MNRFLKIFFYCIVLFITVSAAFAEEKRNLLTFNNGTVLLDYSSEYGGKSSDSWLALGLIDGTKKMGWSSKKNQPFPQHFLFELHKESLMESFAFDTQHVDDYEGIAAKTVLVEFSTESSEGPFIEVLKTDIAINTRSEHALETPQKARWIRLSILENYGYSAYTELMEFEAFGKPDESSKPINVQEGVYQTNWNIFFLQITEDGIRGCYNHDDGQFEGYYNAGFLNINWQESDGQHGKATLALTKDGRAFNGFWYEGGKLSGTWRGKKSTTITEPSCAKTLTKSARPQLEVALDNNGEATLYGIQFDYDSADLKASSNKTLSQLLNWIQKNPNSTIEIVGHTDSNGNKKYNSDLSLKRSLSVKNWLTNNKVNSDKLITKGYGESKPVADNLSPQGRALNRRVEVKVVNSN